MKRAYIAYSASDLDFDRAAGLAGALAEDDVDVVDPVLIAWYDSKAAQMSPIFVGADLRGRWRDYGAAHGGRLEVDVAGDYAFIYADSSTVAAYDAGPCRNPRDRQGGTNACRPARRGLARQAGNSGCWAFIPAQSSKAGLASRRPGAISWSPSDRPTSPSLR